MKEPGQENNFRLQTNLWSGRGRRGMRKGRDLASTSRRLLAPCWKPENGQREPTPDNRKKQMSRNGRKEVEIGYTCIQSRAPKTRHRRGGGGVRRQKGGRRAGGGIWRREPPPPGIWTSHASIPSISSCRFCAFGARDWVQVYLWVGTIFNSPFRKGRIIFESPTRVSCAVFYC